MHIQRNLAIYYKISIFQGAIETWFKFNYAFNPNIFIINSYIVFNNQRKDCFTKIRLDTIKLIIDIIYLYAVYLEHSCF